MLDMLDKIATFGFIGHMILCSLLLNLVLESGLPRVNWRIRKHWWTGKIIKTFLIFQGWFSTKREHSNSERKVKLQVEIKVKTNYGLKTMTRKLKKYGQVESINRLCQVQKGGNWSQSIDGANKRRNDIGNYHRRKKHELEHS